MDTPFLLTWFICIILSPSLLLIQSAPQEALITSLPGFNGNIPSKHYGGYVSIDGKKNLFYYFVESENNPSNDPLVLWLNGGPGCSSFDGFVYEHGPFNFEEGKSKGSLPTLHLNPYSWSKVSNMIYLDSPAGVGYSYSTDPNQYVTGDVKTAADTHTFLLKWFEQYPEFVSNPFYIAGESYAGVYVPTLASNVANGIKSGDKPLINFKGYIIGNGATDPKFDGNALVPFAHGMALISDDIYEEVEHSCEGNYHNNNNEGCNSALDKVYEAIADLNIYDILEPCYHGSSTKKNATKLPESFQQLGVRKGPVGVRQRMFGRAWPFRAPVRDGLVPSWTELAAQDSALSGVPCVNDEIATTWLNTDAVRQAVHAKPESIAGPWELCSDRLSYYHDTGSMIPYHINLTTQGYKALIFSGDHDMCIPYTGSQAWTRFLGHKIVDEWRAWKTNDQVAGYLQGYENNLIFLTVKGAGHTVPEYKPQEALDFYSRWLGGKPI